MKWESSRTSWSMPAIWIEVEVEKPGRDRLDVLDVLDAELVFLPAVGGLGECSRVFQGHWLGVHTATVGRTADTRADPDRNERGGCPFDDSQALEGA